MNDSGFAQIGSIHVQWTPDKDEVRITNMVSNAPPLVLNARQTAAMLRILAIPFGEYTHSLNPTRGGDV